MSFSPQNVFILDIYLFTSLFSFILSSVFLINPQRCVECDEVIVWKRLLLKRGTLDLLFSQTIVNHLLHFSNLILKSLWKTVSFLLLLMVVFVSITRIKFLLAFPTLLKAPPESESL